MRVEFVGAARHDTVNQSSVPRVGEVVYIDWGCFEVERVTWTYQTGNEAIHPRVVVLLRKPEFGKRRRWWR